MLGDVSGRSGCKPAAASCKVPLCRRRERLLKVVMVKFPALAAGLALRHHPNGPISSTQNSTIRVILYDRCRNASHEGHETIVGDHRCNNHVMRV
jgi:hypothetical protein